MSAMRRRQLLASLGALAAAGPCGAAAQVSTRRPLVVVLAGQSAERSSTLLTTLAPRLEQLGYVAGREIDIVYRFADGDEARVTSLVDELVRLKPDVMVASHGQIALAMRQATTRIPIVSGLLGNASNPALGLVGADARPQGNVTGILNNVESLAGKMLALASEVVRGATRMGALLSPGFRQHALDLKGIEAAAAVLGIDIAPVEVGEPGDLDGAFQALRRERVEGVLVFGHVMFLNERNRIAALAIETRLPTMYPFREHADAGGLMSYGVDLRGNFRRAADFVDRILKGTRVEDLPVELPTKFELVVNLKTAKAIGLEIPATFLIRADEVIE